ncbi:unnamed protein product [Ceutorhynchus assimilis]|uniref:Uncharacterized protein n=1 Tax=Ceutorhynchus assimilis TaxID=467358 RepID=A0A9N9QND2_9CUCU|nr:unnamed protein product [Ceutorhynchus assimilis]
MDKGEHSRKNDSPDEEKPLKKARYMWEIKGKGHLKDSSKLPVDDTSGSSEEVPARNPSPDPENCCRAFFVAQTEDFIDQQRSEDEESDSTENEIPVTMVSAQAKDQDYYLRKWHARQIARGFVDNTINSMLEHWIDRPFDPSTIVEDTENDGQVEDDAILMAIQSHGLQSDPNLRPSTLFSSNSNSSVGSNVAIAGSIGSESRTEGLNNNQEPAVDNLENLQKEQENELLVGSSSSSLSVETASPMSNPFEAELDFLNAAVSVAIQKKGLTYG